MPQAEFKQYSTRKRNIFDPESNDPFKISRSKIDLYFQCPRCFYLDQRLGVKRPQMPAFTLNNAVDALLKKEFDIHRVKGKAHPLMDRYGILAVPAEHPDLNRWRDNFNGIQTLFAPAHLLVFGAIDDVWVNKNGEFMIVDYKATSKRGAINMDEGWGPSYRRQMEIYQWLFRKNGFNVSSLGYFVYCNGDKDKEAFDGKLEFSVEVISYDGDDSWIEGVLHSIKKCLLGELPPQKNDCEYCAYRFGAQEIEAKKASQKKLF